MSLENGQNPGQVSSIGEPGTAAALLLESPAGEIRKTPLMLAVEQRFAQPGEELGDILFRMYVAEDKNFAQISREISAGEGLEVSRVAIRNWMKKLRSEVPIKQIGGLTSERMKKIWQNPEHRERVASAMRDAWKDAEKGAHLIAARRTPEALKEKRQAMSDRLAAHPEHKAVFIRAGIEARKQSAARRRQALFGDNPGQALAHMLVDKGLKRAEIAERLGVSVKRVGYLIGEYKVRNPRRRKVLATDEIHARRDKIQRAQGKGWFVLLTKREQEALLALYPREGVAPTPFDVAADIHVTGERVRQLDNKGLAKLNKLLEFGADALKRPARRIRIQGRVGLRKIEISAQTLEDLYLVQGLSLAEAAKKLEISAKTVYKRLVEFKIERRKRGRPRKNL